MPVNTGAEKIILELGLGPLPVEGGYYRRIWESAARLADGRPAGSLIWFLLTAENFSALHRLDAEEIWHFHRGDAVEHVQLNPQQGTMQSRVLGGVALAPLVVPAGVWQGARLVPEGQTDGWALLSCAMTPAWMEGGFELGRRAELEREFSAAAGLIAALTR
ncbi:MAG: cupin domain-containing protein [Opitutaceae bacterium]|nr:cupin domain-containing protein [Opitutaceae bacterium]